MITPDGRYCPCWESQLPKAEKVSINASSTASIERFSECLAAWAPTKERTTQELTNKLKSYGLDSYEIEMLFDRFFDGLEWSEMVKKRGWASTGAASYIMKRILSKLRKRGFNLR